MSTPHKRYRSVELVRDAFAGEDRIITEYEYDMLLQENRFEGILEGLHIASEVWNEGMTREEIAESEDFYKQELIRLRTK